MRWRQSGTNWEGRQWRTAPSLNVLLAEHDTEYPQGNSSLDGTVASKRHDQANPVSDHRPFPYTGPGVVHAYDWWFPDLTTGEAIFDAIRATRDQRIAYIIFNSQIVSSTNQPWVVRPYNGPNPHDRHGHLSVRLEFDADIRPWNVWTNLEDNMLPLALGDGTGDRAHKQEDVRYLQELLNRAGASLSLDGVYGPATATAVAAFTMPTGNPAGQAGEWLGGRQLGNLTARLVGGVSVNDVKGLIAQSRIDPR